MTPVVIVVALGVIVLLTGLRIAQEYHCGVVGRYTALRVVGVLCLLVLSVRPVGTWQQAAIPACGVVQDGMDIGQLVTRFHASVEEYRKTFRNLVAEEAKIIEVYRASGAVEKRRQIDSDLLVYHSSRNDATTEYRDVRAVDGKALKNRGERALKLLTDASRAVSVENELEAIDRETKRYEFTRHLRGSTIYQAGLPEQWRDTYQVELVGREQIAGRDVVVLAYRQVAGPGSRLPLPKAFGNASLRSRGSLWLDAQTCQLWRRVWELAALHPATPDPLVMIHSDSVYAPSRFGIPVPERIVFEWRQRFSHPKDGPPLLALSERTTFTYGAFSRFDVATDEKIRMPEARDR